MLVACNVVAACFLCIACLQCVVAVEPELFGQKTIINDEYCDLFDGSDEPHTSACSHLKVQEFHCKSNGNKGITNVTIAASKVNDGTFIYALYFPRQKTLCVVNILFLLKQQTHRCMRLL